MAPIARDERPTTTGPARLDTAAQLYTMPVYWPGLAYCAGRGPRMWATEAGGRPMAAPEALPKRTARARVQRRRTSREESVVVRMWMFRAPKLLEVKSWVSRIGLSVGEGLKGGWVNVLAAAYGHQQPADGAGAVQDAEEPEGLDGVFREGGAKVVVAVSSAEASFCSPLQRHGSLGS